MDRADFRLLGQAAVLAIVGTITVAWCSVTVSLALRLFRLAAG